LRITVITITTTRKTTESLRTDTLLVVLSVVVSAGAWEGVSVVAWEGASEVVWEGASVVVWEGASVVASVGPDDAVTNAGVGSTVSSTSVAGVGAMVGSISGGIVLPGEKTSSHMQVPHPSVKIPPAFSQVSSEQNSGAQPHTCTVMS
jgi:hypothetical protein